ncbi:MAG: hypothetical protein SFW65_08465 [Alphaproteobacteria bacterium]|nr:hypothetical protein [Alphaproteobacteria bacterium]
MPVKASEGCDYEYLLFQNLESKMTIIRKKLSPPLPEIMISGGSTPRTPQVNKRNVMEPDYKHWARMATWDDDQAAALLKGLNPDKCYDATDYAPDVIKSHNELSKQIQNVGFGRLHDLVPYHNPPYKIIAWAKKMRISIPRKLTTAVKTFSQKPQEIIKPKRENLTAQTKEKATLMKIIVGLLLAHYKTAIKEKIPKISMLHDSIIKTGIQIDDETLGKWIKEAWENHYPDARKEK